MAKRFKLQAAQIERIAPGLGGCVATDRITVEGARVGYMVREEPGRPGDSGWVFMAGTEDDAYMDEAANFEIYDVNTIANYDRDIVRFLGAAPGSAFARDDDGALAPTEDTAWPQDDAPKPWPPPGFPLVEGVHALTATWSITLPEPFARRLDDGALVLWRPGFTLWIVAFNNDRGEPQAARLAAMREVMSEDATDVRESNAGGVARLTYRLREDELETLTVLAVADAGQLQVAIYFDDAADAPLVQQLADSIAAT